MAIPFQGGEGGSGGGGDKERGNRDEKKGDLKKVDDGKCSSETNDNDNIDELEGACGGVAIEVAVEATPSIEEEEEEDDEIPYLRAVPEEIEEEVAEARYLYFDFVREELHRSGLQEPPELRSLSGEDEILYSADRILDWGLAGRELRRLSDSFSSSPERQNIRRRASEVVVETIDCSNFYKFLSELFKGGHITMERILMLLCFCTDVAIFALRKGCAGKFNSLIMWSMKYIARNVAQWVHDHGGWLVVIRSAVQTAYQVSACVAFLTVAVTCVFYMVRNSQS